MRVVLGSKATTTYCPGTYKVTVGMSHDKRCVQVSGLPCFIAPALQAKHRSRMFWPRRLLMHVDNQFNQPR
jgi:hypothetical protein